jgi:tetratricopeptide (TPR) repeat protein
MTTRPAGDALECPRRAWARARALAAGLVFGAVIAGCGAPSVVRMIDGRAVEGRFISEYAYALYAIAADAEAHGDLTTALGAFEAAAQEDEESPQIWTRIGGLRCRIREEAARAPEAFERARELDPDYEPLHREQAECALLRRRIDEARGHAARAVELDPNSEEPTLLYASILEASGRRAEAQTALRELAIRRPTSLRALRALRDLSARMGDTITAEQASEKLTRLAGPSSTSSESTGGRPPGAPSGEIRASALGAVDAALANGDLQAARRLGRRARVLSSELAVRAAALGRASIAREQAELVLGADPSDSSARIALAVAADLAKDAALLERALADLPPAAGPPLPLPSPLARLLFAELLDRWTGLDAARAWLGPEGAAGARVQVPADPLLARVEKRVRERLAAIPSRPGG